MNWFYIALLAPALWSVNNHIDKYLISKYFKGGGVGALAIFSSLIGLVVLPFVYVFRPDVVTIDPSFALLLIVNGFLGVLGLIPYFYALQKDEASMVVPIYQTIPVFGFILGYVFLGEALTATQVIAGLLIMAGAIGLSFDISDRKPVFKWSVCWLMLLSSFIVALNALVFKFVAIQTDFWTTVFWEHVGFLLMAGLLSLIPLYRRQFLEVISLNKIPVLGLNGLNEVISTAGGMVMAFATLLAPLALVWVVNGFQPFFVLVYGILLTLFFPHISQESLLRRHLAQKIFFIAVMFVGTYLL